jgi:hypothetical protein
MSMKLTGEDLARNMLDSPRLQNVRYTERQLKIIDSQWPEVGAELRRRQTGRQSETRSRSRISALMEARMGKDIER